MDQMDQHLVQSFTASGCMDSRPLVSKAVWGSQRLLHEVVELEKNQSLAQVCRSSLVSLMEVSKQQLEECVKVLTMHKYLPCVFLFSNVFVCGYH